jgi:hypothetical protein
MLRAEEPFFEVEQLLFGAVIEHLDPAGAEVDIDALTQFRQGFAVEIVVDKEGDLAGCLVELDDIGLGDVAEQRASAADVSPEDGRQIVQETAMHKERLVVLPAYLEIFACQFDFAGVAGGVQEFEAFFEGARVIAEEGANIGAQSGGKVTERDAFAEVGQGDINEQVTSAVFFGAFEFAGGGRNWDSRPLTHGARGSQRLGGADQTGRCSLGLREANVPVFIALLYGIAG